MSSSDEGREMDESDEHPEKADASMRESLELGSNVTVERA
jgi:hypothetical protein